MHRGATLVLLVLVGSACGERVAGATIEPTASPRAQPAVTPAAATPPATSTRAFTTPTRPSLRISDVDGMTQLFVPAGTFTMGGVDVYAEDDELPAQLVRMHAFWIDQVEVTNGMYALCIAAGACRQPSSSNSDNRGAYFGTEEFRDYPVVNVTWLDAVTYCTWAGRRLPTEAEWERAARGDDLRTYPWGDEPPKDSIVNFHNSVGDTSRVGSYAGGAGPFGALDMAGNVWEWVADLYKANYYALSPGANPPGPDESTGLIERVIRGGSFQDGRLDLRVSNRGHEAGADARLPLTDASRLGRSSVRIGFRCVMEN